MLRFLRLLLSPSKDVPPDGFGQSEADDLLYARRFQQLRRDRLSWRRPSADEARAADEHPTVGRFGSNTYAVREEGERRFIVRDRTWFGFPDPPEYALFVLDGEAIWCAADFDDWPKRWALPSPR